MIQKKDCFGMPTMVKASLSFLCSSQLGEETKRKCNNRKVVFLTEDELHLLTKDEYHRYMCYLHWWLVEEQHVGPIWLTRRCREYVNPSFEEDIYEDALKNMDEMGISIDSLM